MNILRKIFHYPAKATEVPSISWIESLGSMDDISAIELSIKKISHDFKNLAFQNYEDLKALSFIDEKTHFIWIACNVQSFQSSTSTYPFVAVQSKFNQIY